MAVYKLTRSELDMAAQVGVRRRIMSLTAGHQDRFPRPPDFPEWDYAINSALAEYAVAYHLGKFWSGVRSFSDDVGNVEVRSIDMPKKALKIRSYDKPGRAYVLAYVHRNTVHLLGWYTLADAIDLDPPTIQDQGSVTYLVPQSELFHMDKLSCLIP